MLRRIDPSVLRLRKSEVSSMKNKMDRRSFLKRSAAAAVLVPAATLLTGCEFELKDFLDHLLGQGGGTGLDTKAHLGSCTVQLMEVTLTDREAAAGSGSRVSRQSCVRLRLAPPKRIIPG